MPLTERPTDNDVRDFLGGGAARKEQAKKKTAKERSYLLCLPADEMARIKSIAARRGETMKEFMTRAIIKACEDEEYSLLSGKQ